MEYIFPAVFHKNDDGSYTITYPDLPGCISEGKSLKNAVYMAQAALTQWLKYLSDKKQDIPSASSIESIKIDKDEFINLCYTDIKDKYAIKHTVSIPIWMDEKSKESQLNLSRVLQDALNEKLKE
jgi:predicted RNase H-like HicB family nuclease